jgi:hypothetical protein
MNRIRQQLLGDYRVEGAMHIVAEGARSTAHMKTGAQHYLNLRRISKDRKIEIRT